MERNMGFKKWRHTLENHKHIMLRNKNFKLKILKSKKERERAKHILLLLNT